MRTAVIIERIGPYHAARLGAAARTLGQDNLLALEIAQESREYDWESTSTEGFRRHTLAPGRAYQDLSTREIARLLYAKLDDEEPDAVAINGWSFPEARAAAMWCAARRRVAILMAESQFQDSHRSWWRELVKSKRLQGYDSALVGGNSHAEYLTALGFDRDRIVAGYDVVDNEHFAKGALAARRDADATRASLGLPPRYLLSVARFIPKKNLGLLIESYAQCRAASALTPDLVILGDGPERPKLQRLVADHGLLKNVHLSGFKQYNELPAYFGLAEAFVLPSTVEQWGLVINEAMACGLPVVVSNAAGSAVDLVKQGVNGLIFKSNDAGSLASCLLALQSSDLVQMGSESSARIQRWSPSAFGEGLKRALQLGLEFRKKAEPRFASVFLWAVPAPARKRPFPRTAKTALIVERIGPYHEARLRALAKRLGRERVVALEVAARSSEYAWSAVKTFDYRRVTLDTNQDYKALSKKRITELVIDALDYENPTSVAINGWRFPEARAAAIWCRRNGRASVLMCASQERDAHRSWHKEAVKRLRVSDFGAALVGGQRQTDYVEKLGLPRSRIISGYDVVDNEYFSKGADEARSKWEATQRSLGVPDAYLLCVSRLVNKKNLEFLLNAFALYSSAAQGEGWDLVVVGDGPRRGHLERCAQSLGIDERVRWLGFRQYDELPSLYGLAQAFVLPSTTEQWGLVVNEAMASGLPVLVSRACGSAGDLLKEGVNGYSFDPYDPKELADRIRALESGDLKAMGGASRQIVDEWGLGAFARGIERCVALAESRPRRNRAMSYLARVAWW